MELRVLLIKLVIVCAVCIGNADQKKRKPKSAKKGTSRPTKNAVEHLTYEQLNDKDLDLRWGPPDTSDTVEKYIITVSVTGISTPADQVYETTDTHYIFEDVYLCSTYSFSVDVSVTEKKYNYKAQKLKADTPVVAPLEPVDFKINFTSKLVEWTPEAKSWHCTRSWHLKFYHSYICIKDIVLPKETTQYELTDVSDCLRYVATLQALGQKTPLSSKVVKKEIGYQLSDFEATYFVQNLNYSIDSDNQISLSWQNVNSQSANCVYDYVVSVPNSVGLPLISTRETNLTLTHLNVCGKYRVTVMARTIYQEFIGQPADILVKANTLENEIQSALLTEDSGYLIVTWKFKQVIRHCLEYYTLDLCAIDVNIPCRTFKPSSQILNGEMMVSIPDIIPCVTYKVSISIVDTENHYSYYSSIYRSQEKVFKPPVFKTIDRVTSRSAKLRWKARDQSKNRCPLLSSILECTTDGNSFMSYEFNANHQASDFVTEVNNLSPYTNYSCYLSFNQAIGRSDKSSVIEFITLEDAPSAVDLITASQISHNSVTVSWKHPMFANGVLQMYKLQIRSNRSLYELPSWCNYERRPLKQLRQVTLGPSVSSHEIQGLYPFEEYVITIAAASGVGYGEAVQLTVATAPAAPDTVVQPHYLSSSPFSYTIFWKQPCRPNGILKLFRVIVIGTRYQHPDDRFSYSIMPNLTFPDFTYSVKLPKLRPVYNYQVEISAIVDKVAESGKVSILELSTPASLPPEPSVEHLVRKVNPRSVDGQNGTKAQVTLSKDMFDDSGGDVLYYAVIIGRDLSPNNIVESGTLNAGKWPEMGRWAEASGYDFVFQYQATPPYWNPFTGSDSNESVVFVVGEDASCETAVDNYCNGPLKPNTKYSMKIRAFTSAGYRDSPPLKFSTGFEIENSHANYLLAVCVLLFLGFVVCGLFYVKTRYIPVFVEVTQRMNGKRKLTVGTTKSIPIKTFPAYFAKLQEAPHILRMEFNELKEISAKYNLSDNIAKRFDNYRKNRYVDIVPYDETRVKINTEKGDYINASFIEGHKNSKNKYIACQGPLVATFADFWTMILQYDISVIVMLCQIVENKKTVCEKYFPDVNETLTFDGINVECSIMTSNSLFEERRIIVTRGNKELVVSHIKFLEWPDFGIPSDPEILVDFCHAVRKRWTDKPIVVHCSAGVGRTGTFIACDILLQQLPNSKSVNIFNTVLQLRKQRPGMVQSVIQYTYLYNCVYNGIKKLNQTPSSKLTCLM